MITAVRALSIGTALLTAAVVLPFQAWPTNGSTADRPPAALELARGTFTPPSDAAVILSAGQYCEMITSHWGWETCTGIEAVVLNPSPGTDATVIEAAHSGGHVPLTGWSDAAAAELAAAIEADLRASTAAQSDILDLPVDFVGWRIPPTLDPDAAVMFYAVDVAFDGETATNISATLFDRRGFVPMSITPSIADPSPQDIVGLIRDNVSAYRAKADEGYGAVRPGDARMPDGT
ncbi:MAG: hypothetical protein AAF919_10620 [Pseudomonadota bacterium]